MAVIYAIIPFVADVGGQSGYYMVFGAYMLFGLAGGMTQGTVFQMAASFPPSYMGAVMLGNGIAGIMSNVLRIISLLVWPADGNENNALYGAIFNFYFAAAVFFLCGFLQILMNKNKFAKYHLSDKNNKPQEDLDKSPTIAGCT